MKDIKGFTLVEMLVVISIIAALSITIGVSTNKISKKTKLSRYASNYDNIFSAAEIYVNLNSFPTSCENSACINNPSGCNISLNCLVLKGLLDEKIYDASNPMYKNERNFKKDDVVHVLKIDKQIVAYYECETQSLSKETIYSKKINNTINYYEEYSDYGKCV